MHLRPSTVPSVPGVRGPKPEELTPRPDPPRLAFGLPHVRNNASNEMEGLIFGEQDKRVPETQTRYMEEFGGEQRRAYCRRRRTPRYPDVLHLAGRRNGNDGSSLTLGMSLDGLKRRQRKGGSAVTCIGSYVPVSCTQ